MSDAVAPRSPETPEAWMRRHFAALAAVMVRVVREPALAFDLTSELLAVALLRWVRYPGVGSRVAWVLEFAPALVAQALEADVVPCDERMRNRPRLEAQTVTEGYLSWLRGLLEEGPELDPEARRAAAQLEREAPPPHRIRRVALSPLVRLEGGAREHS